MPKPVAPKSSGTHLYFFPSSCQKLVSIIHTASAVGLFNYSSSFLLWLVLESGEIGEGGVGGTWGQRLGAAEGWEVLAWEGRGAGAVAEQVGVGTVEKEGAAKGVCIASVPLSRPGCDRSLLPIREHGHSHNQLNFRCNPISCLAQSNSKSNPIFIRIRISI